MPVRLVQALRRRVRRAIYDGEAGRLTVKRDHFKEPGLRGSRWSGRCGDGSHYNRDDTGIHLLLMPYRLDHVKASCTYADVSILSETDQDGQYLR